MKIKFIRPEVFYINHNSNNSSINETWSDLNEITPDGMQLIGKDLSAYSTKIKVNLDPAFRIETLIPPQIYKGKGSNFE